MKRLVLDYTPAVTKVSLAIIALALSFGVVGCDKNNAASFDVPEAEAAHAIVNAIDPTTGGIVLQLSEATGIAVRRVTGCGVVRDSSITKQSAGGAPVAFNLNQSWNWVFNCSPDNFTFGVKARTTYDEPAMSSEDSSASIFTYTDLAAASPDFTNTFSYIRNGVQKSKLGNNDTFGSKITLYGSVKINKTSQLIVSGSAPAIITGKRPGGTSFSYTGLLTFKGARAAVLMITNGNVYELTW